MGCFRVLVVVVVLTILFCLDFYKPQFFVSYKNSIFEKVRNQGIFVREIEHSSSTIVLAWRNG